MDKFCTLKNVFKEIYRFEQCLQNDYGLSINEIMTLCTLTGGRFTSSDLARELGVSFPRMSKIISELEKKGYIKRRSDDTDKRRVFLALTIRGKRKMMEIKSEAIAFPQIKVIRKKKKAEMVETD